MMTEMRKILLWIMIILFIASFTVSAVNMRRSHLTRERNIADSQTPEPVPETRSITITATGDCTLATDITTPSEGSFESKVIEVDYDYSYFLRNAAPIFSEDDMTIVNCEGTLSENGEREDKAFAFRGNPEYVKIFTSASVEAANLANNHSRDYGEISLEDTKAALTQAGILNFIGEQTVLTTVNGIKIGLVGINALNDEGASSAVPVIEQVKAQGAEIVILSIHWGIEKNDMPGSEQITLAHKAVDAGADIVIGNHPHVIQGVEKYNGRYIMYSLGNFCFGGNTNPSDKDTMLVRATLTLDGEGKVTDDDNIEFIPCKISGSDYTNNYQPIVAEGGEKTRIEEKIRERTNMIAPLELKFR